MEKEFNDVGLCVPNLHYMVDISEKIEAIMRLVEKGKYFTINRPRQFGKTTILFLLADRLNQQADYVALEISFEGTSDTTFASEQDFCLDFLQMITQAMKFTDTELSDYLQQRVQQVDNFAELSLFISQYVLEIDKKVVMLIDEVDKSSNNQLFLDFLGMLRNKYLQRIKGQDETFHSIILAGVHDVKTLKAKIRPDMASKYNSPWNIAVDFKIDLSFAPREIETMLQAYSLEKGTQPDISAIAHRLYYYSSGYPYLVSKLCKFIDEDILPHRADKNWYVEDVEAAFKMIVDESYTTTLFDSLAKNLENNRDLYTLVSQIALNGESLPFTITNPVINLGHLYGILVPSPQGQCQIHNRIFEQRIYAHLMSEILQKKYREINRLGGPEFYSAAGLDVKLILQRFQAFMKEQYSTQDVKFLEREGRLLFLAYLRSIINGVGFDFKEPNVSQERRMDIVITYQTKRYVIELKIWRGQQYHEQGLGQLSDYLDIYGLTEGFLLIYDFNKNKRYQEEQILFSDKQIFAVWV